MELLYLFNMDKFALLAIYGFFLLSAHSLADDCPKAPDIVMATAKRCINDLNLSEDVQQLIGGDEPDGGKLEEWSLCYYKGIGYYENGAFNLHNIKKFLQNANKSKRIVGGIYKKVVQYVKEANAVNGDDRQRAYTFYLHSYDKEMKKLTEKLWC